MNGYILAGGRSTRMGTSKTELFFDRIVEAARPVFAEVIAVHRIDGAPLTVRTIFEEPHDDQGPIFGLERALRDAGGRCFVIGVDYPLLTEEVLAFLAERTRHSRAHAVIPVWDGEAQTLCAGYDPAVLPIIERRLRERRYDLRGLIGECAPEMIPEAELRKRFPGEPLMNVNTPDELRAAEGLHVR